MTAHAYSLNPMEREFQERDVSATIREVMIGRVRGLVASNEFRDAFDSALFNLPDAVYALFLDGDAIAFSREVERRVMAEVYEGDALDTEHGDWTDLTDDDRAIVAAELHAELRRYRAARPIPTSLATVIPPRAPGFLTDVKGE